MDSHSPDPESSRRWADKPARRVATSEVAQGRAAFVLKGAFNPPVAGLPPLAAPSDVTEKDRMSGDLAETS